MIRVPDDTRLLTALAQLGCVSAVQTRQMPVAEACRLVNLPLDTLRGNARPLFRWLVDSGEGALIPLEARKLVLGK